jgi:hypothetical protein
VWSIDNHTTPKQIDANPEQLQGLQRWLVQRGQPIFWFDDVTLKSPWFQAAQLTAAYSWLQADPTSLHFAAGDFLSGEDVARALKRANLTANLSRSALSTLQALPSPTWQNLASASLKIYPRPCPAR